MMRDGWTVQSRQLGRHLRELRQQAGVSADAVAAELRLHPATIYRYEAGKQVPRPLYVSAMCRAYGAEEGIADALVALAEEADAPGWWRSHNGAIPQWFDTFIGLEGGATHLRAYDAEVVPGLLQTRGYADAIARSGRPALGDSERDERVAVRMQRILARRHPPRFDVIVGEAALVMRFGAGVMREQLRHLDTMSRRPDVTIRVLSAGLPHSARSAGARFCMLAFPDGRNAEPPLVYAQGLCGALYLDKPEEIESYTAVWDGIVAAALPPGESRDLIADRLRGIDDD
jgi:transcriptional regulator with XRE-family HTH domain